jgi:hypothetical protein
MGGVGGSPRSDQPTFTRLTHPSEQEDLRVSQAFLRVGGGMLLARSMAVAE